jgi:hypothetical protein
VQPRDDYLNGIQVVSTTGTYYGVVNPPRTTVISRAVQDILTNVQSTSSSDPNRRVDHPQHYEYQRSANVKGKILYERVMSGVRHTYSRDGFFAETVQPDPYASITIAHNKAIEKLYEQLRGGVDLSVSIAEGGQVYGMLRKASRLATYVGGFTRRTAGSQWLQYQYGLKPLVLDLHGSISELANRAGNSLVLRARATNREEKSITTRDEWSGTSVRKSTNTSRVEFRLTFLPQQSALETIARFSSLNPASIAWELLPFSFVADWFWDLGGYLRNLETALAYPGSMQGGYQTVTARVHSSQTWQGTGRPNSVGESMSGYTEGWTVKGYKDRALLSSMPLPRLPTFSVDLGASRLLSVASLLSQTLGLPKRQRVRIKRMTTIKWQRAQAKARRAPSNPWDDPTYRR